MFKFLLGHIGYFAIMLFFIVMCFIVEGQLSGKFLMLGFVSFAMGSTAGKRTRLGLIDKRYKGKSVIWWQVLVGIAIFAVGLLLMKIDGYFDK